MRFHQKNLDDYELVSNFTSYNELEKWLKDNYNLDIDKQELQNVKNRDIFCDYVVSLKTEDYDFAIKQCGDFLLYYDSPQTNEVRELIKARDIWDQFIEGNYKTAEPGLIFWSTMSKYSPSNYVGKPIICTNPCAEVPLENGGACNLGSLNLSRFVKNGFANNAKIDWDKLAESTMILTRFLDNVVTWNEDLNALEKQRQAAKETRRLGLGVMGIADMLNQLGYGYDSSEGIQIIKKTMQFICNAAYQASASLAGEKGASPIFDYDAYIKCPFIIEALSKETKQLILENGIRNIAIMSIAPTGSISNIVLSYQTSEKNYLGVSGGVEPIFSTHYTRRSESFGNQFFKVFHSTIQAYIDINDLKEKINKEETNIDLILPKYLTRTAHKISSEKRVEIQGIIQKYIDHSISSTINLPEDIQPEIISNIYLKSWRNKLKGVTIYRDGSRFPILSTEGQLSEFQRKKEKQFKIENVNGDDLQVNGDEIIKLPDGKLTTMYHYLKNSSKEIEEILSPEKIEETSP